MSILELQDVHYTYQTQYQKVEALKGITHSFDPGLVHAIVGKSGSGKTTLLSLMAGLDLPTSGQVLCEGVSTAQMKLEQYRRGEGGGDLPVLPAVPPAHGGGKRHVSHGAAGHPAQRGQGPGRPAGGAGGPAARGAGPLPHHALRRGAAAGWPSPGRWGMDTKILLADEPTGNLDTANGENVFAILQALAHDNGYCVVIVTHDLGLAGQADRVLELRDGVAVGERG